MGLILLAFFCACVAMPFLVGYAILKYLLSLFKKEEDIIV